VDAGRVAKAEKEYQQLIQAQPDSPAGYMGMIQVVSLQQDWNRALRLWDTCLAKFPQWVGPQGLLAKATALLKLERVAEADTICRELLELFPNFFGGYYGSALAADAREEWQQAQHYIETCLERFPGPQESEWQAFKGRMLVRQNRLQEAEDFLLELTRKYPGCPEGYLELAKLADFIRDEHLGRSRWEQAYRLFPGNTDVQLGYITQLNHLGEFADAETLCHRLFQETSNIAFRLALINSYLAQYRYDDALREVREMAGIHPDNQRVRRMEAYVLGKCWEWDKLGQAIKLLEQLCQDHPHSLLNKCQLIRAYIHNNDVDKACACMESLRPEQMQRRSMGERRAWYYYQQKDIDRAKATYAQHLEKIYEKAVHAPFSLQRKDNRRLSPKKGEVFLFSYVKDNVRFLPWFLQYYRGLGVDRFFIVDNASSDGTAEYLVSQPDVHLFWSDDLFSTVSSGMRWINELVGNYGEGHWCIFADSDEALVFPGAETGGLSPLLRYMEQNGHEALSAFMLDMYPETMELCEAYRPGEDLISISPYFDSKQDFFGGIYSPYQCVRGGARMRIFGGTEWLEKVPIVKGGGEIKYLGNHHITPARLSDVTGALLHFNLAQKAGQLLPARDIVASDDIDGRISYCRTRYSNYKSVLKERGESFSNLCADSLKYVDSRQLVSLGLMQKPADFHC
jgi:tetratricopeptide (TPR) repeat protein